MILYPVKLHSDGFGLALLESAVTMEVHFGKGGSEDGGVLDIMKWGTKFSFSGRGKDGGHYGAMNRNGGIGRRWCIICGIAYIKHLLVYPWH
jgi:hypothetical protein